MSATVYADSSEKLTNTDRAFWQHPLLDRKADQYADHFLSGPLPNGAGDQTYRAFWQYPLLDRKADKYANHFVSGPLPNGSGDQEAILEMDPKLTPWGFPLVIKQEPVTMSGMVSYTPHKHPYPELIGWFSTNKDNQQDLGGEITIYIGEEMEQHTFSKPTAVWIPANVPHGVVVHGKMTRPIVYLEAFPQGKKGNVVQINKEEWHIPDFKKGLPTADTGPAEGGIYGKYFVSGSSMGGGGFPSGGGTSGSGVTTGNGGFPGGAGIPSGGGDMSKMFNAQVTIMPDSTIPGEKNVPFFTYTWEDPNAGGNKLSDTATHNPHAHPYNENLIYFSSDPEDPHNLGANYCIYTGKEFIQYCFDKPFISSSAPFKHLHAPLIRKNMTRPVVFVGINNNIKPFKEGSFKYSGDPTAVQYHDMLVDRLPATDRPQGFNQHFDGLEASLDAPCTVCHGKYVPHNKQTQ